MFLAVRWLAGACTALSICALAQEPNVLPLAEFPQDLDLSAMPKRNVKVTIPTPGTLRLETGSREAWPGIDLRAPGKKWDLSGYEAVVADVRNVGQTEGTLCLRVDNPGANGLRNCLTERVVLKPGEQARISVPLERNPYREASITFIGMRGTPVGTGGLDTANIVNLVLFAPRPKQPHVFEISRICAEGRHEPPAVPANSRDFFPMIDEFGQYMHRDWPGKTHSVEGLRRRIAEESADLTAHPGTAGRNAYGGWADGPQLESTGFFYPKQHEGKWWLVDPEGRLFWSNGIDGVRDHNATPITDREHYYADLPEEGSPFAAFYATAKWAPKGYYKDKGEYRTYDFTRANLLRKYGDDWQDRFAAVTQRRLRSWGINTIANWSSEAVYLRRKTPYVVAVHYGSPDLRASKGMWKKFSDVFDPGFRAGLAKRLEREIGKSAGDPWCIGYFVDNELGWGSDTSLAVATLACPADQKAKQVFVDDLKTKYQTVGKLNAAWGSSHASWDALLAATKPPDRGKAKADLQAFYTKIAETYFRTAREEVKRIAPNQLYLGCRFSNRNDRVVRAAAGFCDVISFNRYTYNVAKDKLPAGIDKPMIIGEFHFGALDRGMFHTGLRKANDQEHRAQLYADYVRSALSNPLYVGAHWFIYKDQAATGRGDGENYQIGFIDGCDTPYPEIIAKSREVAAELYTFRLAAK